MRSSSPVLAPVLVLVLVLVLGGCSSIPQGGDPATDARIGAIVSSRGPSRTVLGRGGLGSVAVAPITTLALAQDQLAKGWRIEGTEGIDAGRIRGDVVRALAATERFDRVREAGPEPFSEAWTNHDDFVVTVSLENVRTHDDGRNGWWIPNIGIWFMWMVPSWWVATEDYSLTLDAHVVVASAESGAVVGERSVPVRVEGRFDEFDRGWQFFGFIYTSFDPETWRAIAAHLWPEAQRQAAVEAALATDALLRAAAADARLEESRRKTLLLSVGVSRYKDPVALPPVPFAADDARAVAGALRDLGEPAEHALVLADEDATTAAVTSAVAEHLGRARAGDTVLLTFAGYGSRDQSGHPALLLHDHAVKTDAGVLPLETLARLLAPVAGNKLVVVDAGFGGRGRSVAGGGAAEGDDLAAFAEASGAAVILAGGPMEPALAPPHLGGGLLTSQLLRGLRGAADENRDGRLTAAELFAFARPRVVAASLLEGERQEPRARNLDAGFMLVPRGDARR